MVIVPTDIYGGAELASLIRREHVTHAFVTTAALATVDPAGPRRGAPFHVKHQPRLMTVCLSAPSP